MPSFVDTIQVLEGVKSVLVAILIIVFLITMTFFAILKSRSDKSKQTIALCATVVGTLAMVLLFIGAIRAPRNPHVLWVDQNPVNNAQSRRIMNNMGISSISEAHSSGEALSMLDKDAYDLLITRVDCLPKSDSEPTCTTDANKRSPAANYENGEKFIDDAMRRRQGLNVIIYDKWFTADSALTRNDQWINKGVRATNQILLLLEWVAAARSDTGRDSFSFY
jgi:hypothetical protein